MHMPPEGGRTWPIRSRSCVEFFFIMYGFVVADTSSRHPRAWLPGSDGSGSISAHGDRGPAEGYCCVVKYICFSKDTV